MDLITTFKIDGSRSPSELSGMKIPKAEWETSLMENSRKYSEMPLSSIEAEGLRLLLGQNLYLDAVVPAALCYLETKPFAGGDFENGALMRTLFLRVDERYWVKNPNMFELAKILFKNSQIKLNDLFMITTDEEEVSFLRDTQENFSQIETSLTENR